MADILELIAAAVWLGVGVYVWVKFRHLNKRLDRMIDDLEADIYRSNGGPWG